MNILFLTQVLPYPLDAGPKGRAYYVLRYLAQRHRVTLVSFTRATDTPAALAHLRELCHAVHGVPMPRSPVRDSYHLAKSIVAGRSFLIERDWVEAMAQFLRALVTLPNHFDAIHADQLWMAPYALWVRDVIGQQQPRAEAMPLLVLDQHNAVYTIPQRLARQERNPLMRALLTLEARKLAQFEVETCAKFARVTWVTEEDYRALEVVARAHGVTLPNSGVIPICLEPESEEPLPPGPRKRVTFVGGLHYPPNAEGILWFAREVFPEILRAVPDVVLTVIGKQPPAQLKQSGVPARNLDITGYIADLRPYWEQTAMSIVPLQSGGGMRVKILDAWCRAVPVVSTTIGAEGIAIVPGENILIADSPADFARATICVLQDTAYARQVGWAGRQQALATYSWRVRYPAWDAVYGQVEAKPATKAARRMATTQGEQTASSVRNFGDVR